MKIAILLSISFVVLTIIGTLTHELGHIIPAKYLGYKTTLHYGSMNWESNYLEYSNSLYNKYGEIDKVPASELKTYHERKLKHNKDTLVISLGGPLQTMGTGILGLLILFFRRRQLKEIHLGILNWMAVFLALFWSRQVFNLMTEFASYFINGKSNMFDGDEAKISSLIGLPIGTMGLSTAILGIGVCIFIVFKIVPKKDKNIFIMSGLIGSGLGYLLWFKCLGPILLP